MALAVPPSLKGSVEARIAEIEDAYEVERGSASAPVIITCEHASERMPEPWAWSERDRRLVGTHWAFDLGAADLARELARSVDATAVFARFSRLLADPNRAETSETLFRAFADGEPVELNTGIDEEDRQRRMSRFYRPFHFAVDREVAACRAPIVLAVHTFTPLYEGNPRELEIGVLFDEEEALAMEWLDHLERAGWRVAPNEPYSGRSGLVYVAERHARRHGRRAIEIEVRQDLAVQPDFRRKLVNVLAPIL